MYEAGGWFNLLTSIQEFRLKWPFITIKSWTQSRCWNDSICYNNDDQFTLCDLSKLRLLCSTIKSSEEHSMQLCIHLKKQWNVFLHVISISSWICLGHFCLLSASAILCTALKLKVERAALQANQAVLYAKLLTGNMLTGGEQSEQSTWWIIRVDLLKANNLCTLQAQFLQSLVNGGGVTAAIYFCLLRCNTENAVRGYVYLTTRTYISMYTHMGELFTVQQG